MWIAVRDEPDENYTYDHLPMAGGPFATFEDANEWIGYDERFIAVEREQHVDPTDDGPVDDDEIRDAHSLACPIWQSDDPADECDCAPTDFHTGVQTLMDRIDSYAAGQGRAS
jgi:hypothetical protein